MARFLRFAALGGAITAPIGLYALVFRPWMRQWGVEPTEAGRALPGDELVPDPTTVETRGITIDAAPEDVWPWLVQMGHGRAGWYSYDELDQRGRSADEIVPAWQSIALGDTMPTHPDGGFVVRGLDPGRSLVLYVDTAIVEGWRPPSPATGGEPTTKPMTEPTVETEPTVGVQLSGGLLERTMPTQFAGSWAFVVEPTADGRTRLVERLRFEFEGSQPAGMRVAMEALGIGVFVMLRRQMLGIRDRAERLAASKLPAPYVPAATMAHAGSAPAG